MKNLLIVAFSVLVVLQVSAKDKKTTKSGIGFKGGLVLSTAGFPEEGSNEQKNRVKPGGFGGINYERQFGKVVAFELELMYANLGVNEKMTIPILGHKVNAVQNFHVAQLPMNLKFYVIPQFNIYIGGYAQYMFAWRAHTITKNSDGEKINEDRSKNLLKDDAFNPIDADGHRYIMPWDGGVQGGVEFISNMGLGVGARFQKGLIDMTNDKYDGPLADDKWVTHTSLQIYLVGHF
jgi:hypothetical protein